MSRTNPKQNLDTRRVTQELFTLTYGAFVAQILHDYEHVDEVNKQLDKIGYNIGVRLIDDFLARNPTVGRCIAPSITNWSPAGDEFSLLLDGNPLTEFVELPEGPGQKLSYNQIICGAIRGALEMVQLEVECRFVQDQLKGDNTTELRVKFLKKLVDALPVGED
ncbi:unnamed protein product [Rotaria magnacalcarata]